MSLLNRSICCAAALGIGWTLCGCDYDDDRPRHHYREVVYEEPGPVVYDYTYYDRGYYDGPYWYYRDYDGHLFHERREEHEWRERERARGNFHEERAPMGVPRRGGAPMHHEGGGAGHAEGHVEHGR